MVTEAGWKLLSTIDTEALSAMAGPAAHKPSTTMAATNATVDLILTAVLHPLANRYGRVKQLQRLPYPEHGFRFLASGAKPGCPLSPPRPDRWRPEPPSPGPDRCRPVRP